MGHELWTSHETGHRRKGTRFEELRQLLDSGLLTSAIVEKLLSCPAGMNALDAAAELRRRDFDVAGVMEEEGGPVVGWVEGQMLSNRCVRDHCSSFSASDLVSSATPILDLVLHMKTKPRFFVLEDVRISGIVTHADLNKPPVRVCLFALISLLEMHLEYWIRVDLQNNSSTQVLTGARLEQAEALRAERAKIGRSVDLIECLQLCDKGSLAVRSDPTRDRLKMGSKTKAEKLLGRLENLRNELAHSQKDLASGTTWSKICEALEWAETVVGHSDQAIEDRALKAASNYRGGLWNARH